MKIEKCPFCGGEAELNHNYSDDYGDSYWVSCNFCGVATDSDWSQKTAIAAWNRRSDAVPVVRGEWVKSDDYKGWLVCSACHDCYVDNAWVNGKKWRYCPNCGAKMESEGGT